MTYDYDHQARIDALIAKVQQERRLADSLRKSARHAERRADAASIQLAAENLAAQAKS